MAEQFTTTLQTGQLSFGSINSIGNSFGIPINQATNTSFQNINPAGKSAGNPTSRFDSGQYSQQKYNEIYHDVDLYLCNSGNFDNINHYFINPAAVLGLTISDTVNDWVVDGSLTFMYLPEGTPNLSKTGNKSSTNTNGINAAIDNGKVLSSYQFRSDGLDLLRVMIMPRSVPGTRGDGVSINKDDTKWMLSYVFSIYEVEDVNNIPGLQGSYAAYMKCLKLHFHDIRYQILTTTNLEYSTADSKRTEYVPGLANDTSIINGPPRATKTGIALAEIFNKALANPQTGGCDEFAVDENSSLWELGESKLFYTSPAQATAYDDTQYIYSHHVSETPLKGVSKANDLSLLHTERAKTFGLIEPLSLTPISSFFKKAGKDEPGELQKEHFYITSLTQEASESDVTTTFRAPVGKIDQDVDLKTAKYGQIISYSFVDMSPAVNSNMFLTAPVYSVDVGKREFNIQFTNNDVKSARTAIAETYISELYKRGSSNDKLFLPMLHKSKKDLNIFPVFSLNGDNKTVTQKNGILNLIYTGLFQNACICFKTYGLTLRESGTFIGIDKTTGCEDNDYNNKLYGQWFVVKVDHIFEAGAYMNVIYAVKIHRYTDLKAKFESLLE